MMKLWLLRPVKDWDPWYDKAFGFVVRAETEKDARKLASDFTHGDEGKIAWIRKYQTTCEELTMDGEEGIIIEDFASA